MTTLVIATRNLHKAEEIRAFLGGSLRYLTLRDFPDAPEIAENGRTFAENAALKSAGIAEWIRRTGGPVPQGRWAVLADDSGLEVDALGGAPGVHSARFASAEFGLQVNAPDAANNMKLLREMARVPLERRGARFRCVLSWVELQGSRSLMFEGSCEGRIGILPRGNQGFGYDPLFTPEGWTVTLAELDPQTKNRLSHRARALAGLGSWLETEGRSSSGPA
jgi:XTP/dITP diphosphohydrolase